MSFKKNIKYFINFLFLLLSLLFFFAFFNPNKISTNVFDLFPKIEERKLLDIYSSFNNSNKILIYTKQNIDSIKALNGVNNVFNLKEDIYVIDINKDIKLESFYDDFLEILPNFDDIKYYSQDILNIENSRVIFDDVNLIMTSSIIFLIFLYLFILRIPFLSLNTIITIASANLLALSTITIVYDSVNIMALNFGIAIGNLAIDYMLHHHFFNFYTNKFRFNSSVFAGFITTFIGFFVCLFVPFPLLSQLSLYAMVCLLVSYLSFGILYQIIGFKNPVLMHKLSKTKKPFINTKFIFLFSFLFFVLSIPNLKLDFDLDRLDYHNVNRLNDKDFFISNLKEDKSILVISDSKDLLNLRLEDLSKIIQLKVDSNNLKIIESENKFYAKLDIKNEDLIKIQNLNYIDSRSIKELSDAITTTIYKPMIIILCVLIISMITLVFLITKYPLSTLYIIFPLSWIFLFLSTKEINIMHLFSILIVVVSSVDYGIYVAKEGENINSLHSIIFSILTTIFGFGFLSFSNILALHSFGIVIVIGLSSILFLLLFTKESKILRR